MLRHTFASRLAQRGAPIAVISQLLGHQNLEQTMVYSHLSLDCLQQSIDLIRGDNAKGPRDS
jgi:site-specific recombinase XerD